MKRFMTMLKLTCLLTCCLVHAVASDAQSRRKVTMNLERSTIREVLAEYQRLTGVFVVYSSDKLSTSRVVSGKWDGVEEDEFFDRLLEGSGMSWRIEEGYVLIVPLPTAQQEEITARGRVMDAAGLPLAGVTIRVKGTTRGGTTDAEGRFRIAFPASAPRVLQFSFVGMKAVERAVVEGEELLVTMEEEERAIEEVVVTGLFTRRANSYTGAIASVKGEELRRVGNANVIASLKTIDPAFMVVENLAAGSNPNALPEIQLRGQTGLSSVGSEYQNNPNQPLFILDGFETTLTKVLDLDVNLVESVTLLKDATAKAMYGSKAANGVVVIETIRPARGKMKINYTGSLEVQAPDLSSYNLTTAAEKVTAEVKAGLYASEIATEQIALTRKYTELVRLVEAGVNTYWLDKPLRVGVGNKHSLYLEGGDEFMLYAVDLSYNGVAGVMKGSKRSTISGGVTLSYRTKEFLFRNKLSVDGNAATDSPYGSFSLFARMNPYNMIYDEDGNMEKQYQHGSVVQPNPLWNGEVNTKYASSYTYITNNFHAEWLARENLRLIVRFGFSKRASASDTFRPGEHTDYMNYSGDAEYVKGSYSTTRRDESSLNGDVGAAWSLTRDKHLLFTNAQLSVAQNKYDYFTVQAQGFPNSFMDHVTSGISYYGTRPSGAEGISR